MLPRSITVSLAILCMFTMACAIPIATWVSMGLQLTSTILPTIPGIIQAIEALAGKTLTAAQVSQLQNAFNGAAGLFQQIQVLLTQYQANPAASIIAQIQAILSQINTNMSTLLADVQITDPATVQKITAVVDAFTSLAAGILAVLPLATMHGRILMKKSAQKQIQGLTAQSWAMSFNSTVSRKTGNKTVDSAFSGVRAVVPN